jgi:hypothetical protein
LGNMLSGKLGDLLTTTTVDATGKEVSVTDWTMFWLIPAVGVLFCFAVFVLFFRDKGFKKPALTDLSADRVPAGWAGDDPVDGIQAAK